MPDNDDVEETLLTTADNPFNPFLDYDNWSMYDEDHGYFTIAYLARTTISSDDISESDENEAISTAMKSIIDLNITGNYLEVTRDGFDKEIAAWKANNK